MPGKVGRAAVEHDAGPDPVGVPGQHIAVAQDGGAVAERALAGQVMRYGIKSLELRGNAFRAIGIRKMLHQRNLFDLRQGVEANPGGTKALGHKAKAVHSGVHLEKHAVRQLRLVGGQPVDLLVAMDRVPQAQPGTQLQVARVKAAFEQQDRTTPVQRAQALRLGQIKQCKAVGAAQGVKDSLNAVAISIGLDDSPDACIRRGSADTRQVMAEGGGVNGRKNGTWHGAMKW